MVVKSINELKKLRESLKAKHIQGNNDQIVLVKVAMSTCSIASGSDETLTYLKNELEKRNIEARVTQTGCMCYCYAEPTVEITLPGKEPVMFGYVDMKKADEIIEGYIKEGKTIEGIIDKNYETI